jgi:hypothetical protein
MTCPYYTGKTECDLKSKYYILSQETIENHCTLNFQLCSVYIADKKQKEQQHPKKLDDMAGPQEGFRNCFKML